MSTADVQGSLWGAKTRDYATVIEGFFHPLYAQVLAEAGVGPGVKLLDVGCGPGLAASIAAGQGAQVSGLDAAPASLAIARERTPHGDFRLGDMQALPWPDAAFDVVTSFNAFQFAASLADALHEAGRVLSPAGRVAMVIWGPAEELDLSLVVRAIVGLLPPSPPPQPGPALPDLTRTNGLQEVLRQAGFAPLSSGDMNCRFTFPDLPTAVRGYMSIAPAVAAAQRLGEEPVRGAIVDSLRSFTSEDGTLSQNNRIHWVIAARGSHKV